MTLTVRDACLRILEGGTLADKLVGDVRAVDDVAVDDRAVDTDAPHRAGPLVMIEGAERLPKLSQLDSAEARAVCLARFAHHELMAVELFAWALLRFPDAPAALRRGMWAALIEEQQHLRLYLARLQAHGAALGDVPLSGYFWKLLRGVRAAPDPLAAFLCTQGLTLEAANLDFSVLYRDAFRSAGDEDSALVMQQVHNDEIAHVKLAHTWLLRHTGVDDDLAAYQAHVPFPLSLARAKGRRFETGARRRAGFSNALIDAAQAARPYATTTTTTSTSTEAP